MNYTNFTSGVLRPKGVVWILRILVFDKLPVFLTSINNVDGGYLEIHWAKSG